MGGRLGRFPASGFRLQSSEFWTRVLWGETQGSRVRGRGNENQNPTAAERSFRLRVLVRTAAR